MYCCGSRDGAHLLLEAPTEAPASPEYALPGDRVVYAPDRPADVRHLDLDLTLDFATQTLRGAVTTTFSALFEELRQVTFDAAELAVERVTLAATDAALDFWADGEKLRVRLDRAYRYGEEFAVRVEYQARPRAGFTFVRPTEGDPALPVQAWSMGETEYHHYWFPCHDYPNDRATTALTCTVPGSFLVISNGRLVEARENPDGTKTYVWRMDVPFPAYLLTLVAGEFAELRDAWRDVPVTYYVPRGREEDGRRMLGKTPRMIAFFSERFGVDYPYPKYAQTVAQQYLGAMENASATTHSYRFLPDERVSLDYSPEATVAHELVHQWHGDLIAVRDWSETWLKEGFATYFAAVWTQHELGEDEFRVTLQGDQHDYLEADARGRRPIVYGVTRKNADELFDRHPYNKASCVLHMLRQVVGEQPFWRGIQLYTRRNAGREVVTADFERAMEEATGHSLARFFEQWIHQAGHPELRVSYVWDDERKLAKLSVAQTQRVDDRTPLFVTPVDVGFLLPEGAEPKLVTFRVALEEVQQTFYLPLPARPLAVRFDQGGWLLKTLDFDRPTELLAAQLWRDPDVLGRIEAAEALGKKADVASVAELERALGEEPFWAVRVAVAEALAGQKTQRALSTLLEALERERHPKVRRALLRGLGQFRAPEQAALAERAAGALRGVLERGEPSYYAEAAAATALGRTRTPDAFEALMAKAETPSWLEIVRGGVFVGLGELGDERAVDVLTSRLLDPTSPMDVRAAAAQGLLALGRTGLVGGEEARTRVVEALMAALADPWEWALRHVIAALRAWGDARAIPALRRVVERHTDERVARAAREAILALQRGRSLREELRRLRGDLDILQGENRELRERLAALEARLGNGNGAAADVPGTNGANGARKRQRTAKRPARVTN
jgi:aminopeptidase N